MRRVSLRRKRRRNPFHKPNANPAPIVRIAPGTSKTVATTTFQNAGAPLVKGKCFMLQQASFYEAQWAKGTKIGPDGDIFAFYMPTIAGKFGVPVEGGGEFLTAFSNRPEVQASAGMPAFARLAALVGKGPPLPVTFEAAVEALRD